MTATAVIFPGQGSQAVGMGRDVIEISSAARGVFDRANAVLGFDLASLCFDGPPEELEKTDIQQPAIFVTSVAIWEAILEGGGRRKAVSRTGGLSLGEYTALYAAGSVTFEAALALVRKRGQLMQAAAEAAPGGMVSLIGTDEKAAYDLCDKVRENDVLSPSNFNCPGQIVISGSSSACQRAVANAAAFECRAVALPVAGAFHSSLMQSAADGLRPVLDATEWRLPEIPVIANVNADYHGDVASIRDTLQRQVVEPVLWQRCVERLIADGIERFVEVGPGRVLSGLMRKIDRKQSVINVSTADSIPKALESLAS